MNSSLNPRDRDVADRLVAAFRDGLSDRLQALILFGSRVSGSARSDSDWDLLVVADELPKTRLDRLRFLKSVLAPADRAIVSLIARTPEEFQGRIPALYLDIGLDGRILFDQRGFARRFMADLKERIREAGLWRERTPSGDVWHWGDGRYRPWTQEWRQSPDARP